MRANNTTTRFIKHTSIQVGDTIKVEQTYEDATIIKIGRVQKRDHSSIGTDYLTAEGIALYTHTRDDLSRAKITLLDRPSNVTELESRLW